MQDLMFSRLRRLRFSGGCWASGLITSISNSTISKPGQCVQRPGPVLVSIMNQIILTAFTDPIMRLSYECQPVNEQLAAHYQGQIVFKYVMSGPVRDVSNFMLPEELLLPPEEGIRVYNRRLA